MKATFIYTAIGILVIVILLQIYYMREGFFTSSADKLSALNIAITLCSVGGTTNDCIIAAGNGGDLSDGTNVPGVAMTLDSSDNHRCNSADNTMNDNTYLTNVLRPTGVTNATILTVLKCIKAGFTASATAAAVDASGNTVDASGNEVDASGNTVDASGNLITLSLSDLFYALRFGNTTTETTTTTPIVLPASTTNSSFSEEEKNRLSKDIAKSVKDQILSDRSLQPVVPASTDSCANDSACVSDSCSQGADYMSGAPFNANDYIRKDSIPCYGCTLPK